MKKILIEVSAGELVDKMTILEIKLQKIKVSESRIEIKRELDYEAETKILQATDEVMNSEEMAQIAQQQAYIDLQNSYNQATNDSAERVGALANLATDI